MSWVANVLLSIDFMDDTALVDDFDVWLQTQAPRCDQPEARGVGSLLPLHDSCESWGGPKNPEVLLWSGACNHADIPAIVRRFATTPWRRPDLAQLMIQDQEQGAFRLWMIRDGAAPVRTVAGIRPRRRLTGASATP